MRPNDTVIATKIDFDPFALSPSINSGQACRRARSWFDWPVLSGTEVLTTNGLVSLFDTRIAFSFLLMSITIGMTDSKQIFWQRYLA